MIGPPECEENPPSLKVAAACQAAKCQIFTRTTCKVKFSPSCLHGSQPSPCQRWPLFQNLICWQLASGLKLKLCHSYGGNSFQIPLIILRLMDNANAMLSYEENQSSTPILNALILAFTVRHLAALFNFPICIFPNCISHSTFGSRSWKRELWKRKEEKQPWSCLHAHPNVRPDGLIALFKAPDRERATPRQGV